MRGLNLRSRVILPATLAALLAAAPSAGAQAFPAPSLSVDTAFNPPTGIHTTDFPPPGTAGTRHDIPAAVAVHGNRIYTVGVTGTTTTSDNRTVAIAARRLDGTLDPSFDGDGKLTLSIGAKADIGTGIAVLPADGSLRVLVATDVSTTSTISFDVAVVGLNADGTPDTTFGAPIATGVRGVWLLAGTENEIPARIEAGPGGRLAIVGARTDGIRDDFVALLEANGSPVTGPGFGADGVRFSETASPVDRGVDVAFRPGGGLVTLVSIDAPATPDETVLRAFNADGTLDMTFGTGGNVLVGNTDTVPGGLIVHDGRLWVSGSTNVGSDTDAFLARVNADGAGLQVHRFDMRGPLTPSLAVPSRANDIVVVPGVPATIVVVGSVTHSSGVTDWAAAAFNNFDGDLARAGMDDIVIQAPGDTVDASLVTAAAGAQGWLAVAGRLVGSDNDFGNARLLVDADKTCDLAVAASEPGEIVFRGSSPAALTVRVQNVGTRACGGTLSVAAPYGMAAVATGLVLPGATFVAPAIPTTYHGPRRADDVLLIALDAPADANSANNRAAAHVVFSYCDLAVARAGAVGAIPTEGTRRFELSLRNQGTTTCRVRVGRNAEYPLARGKPASDTVAVAAPPGARPGKRVVVALRASATDDVEPSNNAVTVSPTVVRVGDSDVRSWGARRFAGTARRGAGDLAASRLRPARVDVAVLRVSSKSCSWLSSTRGSFTGEPRGPDGRCGQHHWLRADGTTNWRLALRRSLSPGRYVVFSRTTIRAGFREASFSPKDRNRVEFTVR